MIFDLWRSSLVKVEVSLLVRSEAVRMNLTRQLKSTVLILREAIVRLTIE
jgi:hypothetical protein